MHIILITKQTMTCTSFSLGVDDFKDNEARTILGTIIENFESLSQFSLAISAEKFVGGMSDVEITSMHLMSDSRLLASTGFVPTRPEK